MREPLEPSLVAIVGGSGAGKSWLAQQLQARLGNEIARLSLDDFYRDRAYLPVKRRERVNFDHPRAIDWVRLEEVLRACRAGEPIRIPRYDFKTHSRMAEGQTWVAQGLVLVEGLWLLHRRSMRQLFDYSIFIECSSRLRLERRIARDLVERGRTRQAIRAQFLGTVAPMHEQFVAPQRRFADLILRTPFGEKEVQELAKRLENFLPLRPDCKSVARGGAGSLFPKVALKTIGL